MVELSVIVPVYNMAGDGKLEYCLRSLIGQSLENMEIIAVDDASTDNSLEILRRFEAEYPQRVRVVASPENRKQGGARNLGLKEAQGRFIGFMDADDWVVRDMYESMLRLADETGADVVGCDMCRVYEHTMTPTEREACNYADQTGVMDHERRKEYLLRTGPLGTKIYAREIFFHPVLVFPERISYEDNAVSVEIGMRIKHFEHIPEVKVFYYQHQDSTTHTITRKQCEDRMAAMRIMMQYATQNGSLEEYRDVVEYLFTNLFYRNTLFSYMQSDLKTDVGFIRQLGREMKETFPGFRENPYFINTVDAEEKMYIDLQLKSTLIFVLYYNLKKFYRNKICRRQ